MSEDEIYEILCQMVEELRGAHRLPVAIAYTDLLRRCSVGRAELNRLLNGLYVRKRIKVMRGLNDKLIMVR